MQPIIDLIKREPALLIALLDAVLVVAVTFGLQLDPAQKAAIDGVLVVLGGILTRSQVTPANPPTPTPPTTP